MRICVSAQLHPANATSTRTSPAPGFGSGISAKTSSSGAPGLWITTAFTLASRFLFLLDYAARAGRAHATRGKADRQGAAVAANARAVSLRHELAS